MCQTGSPPLTLKLQDKLENLFQSPRGCASVRCLCKALGVGACQEVPPTVTVPWGQDGEPLPNAAPGAGNTAAGGEHVGRAPASGSAGGEHVGDAPLQALESVTPGRKPHLPASQGMRRCPLAGAAKTVVPSPLPETRVLSSEGEGD